jgi:alpha-L-fucosidase
VIEFTIYNSHDDNYLTLADTLNLTIVSDSLELVYPASYERLAPHQSAIVQIGVRNSPSTPRGSQCSGTLVATWGQEYGAALTAMTGVSGTCGIPDYTQDSDFGFHWDPDWFNEVKYVNSRLFSAITANASRFGIFIHWGVYSVPAYGSVSPNEDYAEWYWCRMHDPDWKTKTYQWHEEHYGEDFNYDQFLESFTASAYDPKGWVDLFAKSGARYMVPVTSMLSCFDEIV